MITAKLILDILLILIVAWFFGSLFTRFPELGDLLERWATDDDFWIRRSALLSHLVPLRGGGGDFARFARFAAGMINEKEFFIRKAIGWTLRELCKHHPQEVHAFLVRVGDRASGLTRREAARRLPDQLRIPLLGK